MPTQQTQVRCGLCTIRIPKNRRDLICSNCNDIKHYKCQRLSKTDVAFINETQRLTWTCRECIVDALPVNDWGTTKAEKFKVQCHSCTGYSHKETNVLQCPWCLNLNHKKCINNELGCIKCCEAMIPGFHACAYEIVDDIIGRNKDIIFNPYNPASNVNTIGDQIANEVENSTLWSEISDHLANCTYIDQKSVRTAKSNELSVLSLNIRSVNKNLSKLSDNINEYQKFDVICLNETNCNLEKLPNGLDDLCLEGFHTPIVQDPARASCKGGGLITYVHERVCPLDDIEKMDIGIDPTVDGEFLFVKIKSCKGNNSTHVIGNVYRSPSHKPKNFVERYENVLLKLNRHNKKQVLIMGDLNVDLIKHDQDEIGQSIVDAAADHGFIQVISRPTRVTDHSATLIDHIYTNKIHRLVSSNVITLDISDHLATNIIVSLDSNFDRAASIGIRRPNSESDASESSEYRIFNEVNDAQFINYIAEENWDIPNDLDANGKYNKFAEIYNKHYNNAYPLKSKRIRRKHERVDPKPWITAWLEDACHRKNTLYHKYINDPTIANKITYQKMNKFTEKHIDIAKNKYYTKYFNEYKDNSRKQWQMINSLLNRKKSRIKINKLIDENGQEITNDNDIADKFNEYFSNIASNLKSGIEKDASNNYGAFLKNAVSNSIYVRPVQPQEVNDIIGKLKNKTTLDTKISAIKLASNDLKFNQALSKIITSSLNEGIFPDELKLARVVPIHKEGSKTDVSNYRPISLLTSFSKIYEKIMHNRIVEFMDANNSLHEMQYGFRSGRSCEHALLTAKNILLESLNKKQISLLLMIDFSKAFDLVEHDVLLKKLSHYGIRGVALNWLKSYLQNREQFVAVNSKDSNKSTMKYGVPQGSILGPLLFLIYINDIPGICEFAKFVLYADDANIIISGENMIEIEEKCNILLHVLSSWVKSNGLLLNLKKTNYMVFTRLRKTQELNLLIDNKPIKRVTEAKFLGVIVDDRLTWTSHVKALKAKMSRYVGIMYKIKRHIPLAVRLQIYNSFVQCRVNYCCLVWGFSSKSNIESIFSRQKKGLRAIMPGYVQYFFKDGKLPSGTKSSFTKYNILTIHSIIVQNALIFMHKISLFTKLLPQSLKNTIPGNAPTTIAGVDTFEDYSDWLGKFGSQIYRNSLFYKGPLLYIDNNKFNEIRSPSACLSMKIFRNNVKNSLIKHQSSGEKDEWLANNFVLYNITGLRRSARING